MKLLVQNTIFGESQEFPLQAGEYVLGRAVPDSKSERNPDICLQTRFASERQAVLAVMQDRIVVRHAGLNPTFLNEHAMEYGQNRVLNSGDQLKIGEYIAYLADTDSGEASLSGPDADQYKMQFAALEGDIHAKLLDALDLRRSSGEVDPHDEETRQKIKFHLDRLVDAALKNIDDDEMRAFVARQAIYRRLGNEIAYAGETSSDSTKHHDFENVFQEEKIQNLESRILTIIGAKLSGKSIREDSDLLDAGYAEAFSRHALDLSEGSRDYLVAMHFKRNILDLIYGFGPLQDLLDMPSISEIMVISRDKIFIEKFGVVEDSRRTFHSDNLLLSVITKMVAPVGRRIDKSNPYVDARLQDGSRVNAIIPPLYNSLDEGMMNFLQACVENHLNVVVSGGTGSGKTTMLNCLSTYIGDAERTVTIEDTAELQLKQKHVVTLESRAANMEGTGEVTMRDLVKNSLRMRPDRIVVGECRGGETLDMLQAMNTGHDGSMTTGHANSPIDMMKRLETMVMTGIEMPVAAIRNQIVAAVDLVVQLNRLSTGERKVTHISEVHSLDQDTGDIVVEDIFVYNQTADGGYHSYTGYIPSFLLPMIQKGLVSPESFFKEAER